MLEVHAEKVCYSSLEFKKGSKGGTPRTRRYLLVFTNKTHLRNTLISGAGTFFQQGGEGAENIKYKFVFPKNGIICINQ